MRETRVFLEHDFPCPIKGCANKKRNGRCSLNQATFEDDQCLDFRPKDDELGATVGVETSHELRVAPDPILHQEAAPVERIDGVKGLVKDMHDLLWSNDSYELVWVGLAAPQVGELVRVIVLHVPGYDPMEIINPEIVKQRGTRFSQERCLSLPGVKEEVKRPKVVKVTGLNLESKRVSVRGPDVMAAVLCHEIDHLDGVLITDKGGGAISQEGNKIR